VDTEERLDQVEDLQEILIDQVYRTTPKGASARYSNLRRALIQSSRLRPNLPQFVLDCRTLEHAANRIAKEVSSKEMGSREHVWKSFQSLFDVLERDLISPSDFEITGTLDSLNSTEIDSAWKKALDRRANDPEGAITMARSLLESVCKHLLDEMGSSYDRKASLPTLYGTVADELNLSPSQHTEDIFSRILGSAQQVVEGLGAVRNRHSDAHGNSTASGRPSPRHAELAVNLAGSTASFLVQTYRSNE
jgi:hypothetical protein